MKKNARFYAAMFLAKSAELGLKILKRPATYLPGKIAVTVCPDFLGRIGRPKTVAAVTGTNGKTTVSNMVANILTDCGYKITNNSYGSNVASGIASVLISNSTLCGKAKNDIAVLEVDERSSRLIYPYIKPDFIVCNNLLRDSLYRNASTEFIKYIIDSAIQDNATLIVNGDDIIASAIGSEKNDRVYFGIEYHDGKDDHPNDIKDIIYCPDCGAELIADYYRYNHLGRVHCDKCGFKSPEWNYKVTDISKEKGIVTIEYGGNKYDFHMVNDNITNIYNMVSAVALLDQLGVPGDKIVASMEKMKVVGSRYDKIDVCGKHITTQLAKGWNPIACTRAVEYLKTSDGKDKVAIVVDDNMDFPNTKDEIENVTWVYDCGYEALADPSIKKIIFGGPLCRDHLMHAVMSGVDPNKIVITENYKETVDLVDVNESDDFYILYDLFILSQAMELKESLKKKIEEAGK